MYSLFWYKVKTIFKENNSGVLNYSILQAIIKGSYLDTFQKSDWTKGAPIFFHINDKKITTKLKRNQEFTLEIIISLHNLKEVNKIITSLKKRMSIKKNQKRYSLISIDKPELRNLEILEKEFYKKYNININIKNNEIIINFLTPYGMPQKKTHVSGWMDTNKFLFKFKERLNNFFKLNLEIKNEEYIKENIKITPHWKYIEHYTHKSKSQPNTQIVKGFIGKLYIKGDIKSIMPVLIIGLELHTGSRISNSQGYYEIIFTFSARGPFSPSTTSIVTF